MKISNEMRRIIELCMVIPMLLAILAGCSSASATTKTEEMRQEVAEPEAVEEAPADWSEKYIVTFRIKQSHFTLDISEHIKDSMNEITFEVPVDKEYYDSVSVGTVINDDFRMGSLIMHGSFGKWKVAIDQKEIR